jgi:hypothetical protein
MLLKLAAETAGDPPYIMRGQDDLLWHKDGPIGHAIELLSSGEEHGYANKVMLRKKAFLARLPDFLKLLNRKLSKYHYLTQETIKLDPHTGGQTPGEMYGGAQPWDESMRKQHHLDKQEAADIVMRALHMTSDDGLLEYVGVLSGPELPDTRLAAHIPLRQLLTQAHALTAEAFLDIAQITNLNDTESRAYKKYKSAEANLVRSLKSLASGLEEIFQWAKAQLQPSQGEERREGV